MNFKDIKDIAVIGSGTMGPGIAQSFAKHGYRVHVCDAVEQALKTARVLMRANLDTLLKHGLVTADEIPQIEARVDFTTSLDDAVRNADFVVEAITEKPAAKKGLFAKLDELCKRDAIFASNTSYLNVFELVPESRLPNTVIAHWFAPPHILPLVEVVRESKTSEPTEKAVLELLRSIGKVPVLMKRFVPGFAINRLLRIIGREVFFLLDNGYMTADQLDLAVKASIAPRMMLLGVVQRYDFTGLDLSAGNLQNESFLEPPLDNHPKSLFDLVEQGHLGVKTGKGFFDYEGKSLASILAERDDNLINILKSVGFCLPAGSGASPAQDAEAGDGARRQAAK